MDSGYIKLAANTAEATSSAFTLSGTYKIICDTLINDEHVKLLEERPNGTYKEACNEDGTGIVLTKIRQSAIVSAYGSYKFYKTATNGSVAAAVID